MNRRNRTLIVVGLALVLATLASYLVYRAVQSIPVREVTIVERQMVVATDRVAAGQTLTAERVRLTPWPADAPVPGSFDNVEAVIGRGVVHEILPNEPVTESKLALTGMGSGLRATIPEGMLAMSVRVNDISNVSGFVLPGARVDVIAIASPNDETVSKIVLTNIEVAATNAITTAPEEENARQASNVTVYVVPEDAERLALAANEGQIMLALRNALDVLPTETEGIGLRALFSGTPPPPVRTATTSGRPRMVSQTPPAPPAPPTMNIIRGATRDTVEVKGGRGGGSAGAGSGSNGSGGGGR